jgi:hypothetical protein
VKNNGETFLTGHMFISYDLYLINKQPVHKTRGTISLLRSNYAMHCYICFWLVRMYSRLCKVGLRYKFMILDTYHPGTLYLRQQGCEVPRLFFRSQKGSVRKELGSNCSKL